MIPSIRLTAVALMVVLAPAVRAQDAAQAVRTEMEAKIIKSLAEAINVGAPAFNNGNPDGCYWVYRGALAATMPLLDYRPDLQRSVEEKLKKAATDRTAVERAFTLRAALDEVRAALHKDQPKTDQPRAAAGERSLWDRLGGEAAVKAVVHDFVLAAIGDKKVNFMRGRPLPDAAGMAKLEQSIVEFVSSQTGGPFKYSGKDMAAAHADMKITNEEFDAAAADLLSTLKTFRVPEKETNEVMTLVSSLRNDIVGK